MASANDVFFAIFPQLLQRVLANRFEKHEPRLRSGTMVDTVYEPAVDESSKSVDEAYVLAGWNVADACRGVERAASDKYAESSEQSLVSLD